MEISFFTNREWRFKTLLIFTPSPSQAAKRSRDARRAKENQVAIRATILERENKLLAQELRKARSENHLLKERLCKYEIIQWRKKNNTDLSGKWRWI